MKQQATPLSLRRNLPTILLLVFVLFFLFTARIVYSPLLLAIEDTMGIGHAQAASFFLFITIGYAGMMLFSGFVAASLGHRATILLSVSLSVVALLAVSLSKSLWAMRGSLILLGIGCGLYFPSGVPTVSSLVAEKDEGKALAIHELAPNLAGIIAPIGAIFALRFASWRFVLILLAGIGVLAGILFLIFAKGGRFRGKPPHLANARLILGKSSFWIMAVLFSLGAGAGVGVFSMTPTYLVSERGLNPELVNTLVGVARISNLPIVFLTGYLVDRFGFRRLITIVMLASGIATIGLSLSFRPLLIAAIFLQPIFAASFFPAGFPAISRIAPREMHNLTISFMFPIGYAVGAGLVPYLLGFLGDHSSFALGFLLYGALLICSAVLPFFLDSGRTTVRQVESH
jgi:NNP family nitrate/nitrite transporter-like MFS transporter